VKEKIICFCLLNTNLQTIHILFIMQHVQDLRQLLANREVEEKNQRKLYEAKKTSFEHLEKLKAVKGFFVSLCFFL